MLRGEQDVVSPTPDLSIKSRCYIVLCTATDSRTFFFRSFSSFKAHAGRLSPGTVCHGFPTEGEARVYARGAGVAFHEAPGP